MRSFKGRRGKKKRRKARWFIYVLIHSKFKAQQAHGRYRSRFGIESSYRSMRQLRIRSNSRNPAMRFLFLALGLILVNVWIALRFHFCQIPRQGRSGRPLRPVSASSALPPSFVMPLNVATLVSLLSLLPLRPLVCDSVIH